MIRACSFTAAALCVWAAPANAQPGAVPSPQAAPPEPPAPASAPPSPASAPPSPASAPPSPKVYEPPIPGQAPYVVWEPPVPPEPRHVAPKTSLWVGARLGWFIPLGYLFSQPVRVAPGVYHYDRVPWNDYNGSGPMIELDVGMRLLRNYNVFAFWERAELGAGDERDDLFNPGVPSRRGDSDFWGLGVRGSSDADDLGFLSELALGYRRARARWEDGAELQLTSGFIEARLGLGADIRVHPSVTLSPLLTFGVGTFSDVELVDSEGRRLDAIGRANEHDGHGWITLQLGTHFDAFGKK